MNDAEIRSLDLTDLKHFENGAPHALFHELRERSPLHWNQNGEFWSVLRHADVLAVSRDDATFSPRVRGNMIFDQFVSADARPPMMIELDPPAHTRYRNLVSRGFTPRMIERLADFARRSAAEILERAIEGETCDLVGDVAGRIPLELIAQLMGVPEADRDRVYEIANQIMAFNDPEFGGGEFGAGENSDAMGLMYAYAQNLVKDRQRMPEGAITTVLLEADLGGDRLTAEEFQLFFLLLIVAGIETTRSAIAGAVLAFQEFPDQWQRLLERPAMIDSAIEEVVRWVTPIYHFRRTATRDAEIAGQTIRAGQRVVMWYASANRDPRVFDAPSAFDIGRKANEHLSFGYGRHFCMGASLARLEIRAFLGAMIERRIEVDIRGNVEWMRSNFAHSPKRLPASLRAARAAQPS